MVTGTHRGIPRTTLIVVLLSDLWLVIGGSLILKIKVFIVYIRRVREMSGCKGRVYPFTR